MGTELVTDAAKNVFMITPFQVGLLIVAGLLGWWCYYEYKEWLGSNNAGGEQTIFRWK